MVPGPTTECAPACHASATALCDVPVRKIAGGGGGGGGGGASGAVPNKCSSDGDGRFQIFGVGGRRIVRRGWVGVDYKLVLSGYVAAFDVYWFRCRRW